MATYVNANEFKFVTWKEEENCLPVSLNEYIISFSTKDFKNFNCFFANFLDNITSNTDLPDFKIECIGEWIAIQVPAEESSFVLIAELMREIDNFNMSYILNKNK